MAEVLLARTRAEQAATAFEDFRKAYPRAADFAALPEEEARKVTVPLGLHWRGPLLHRLAAAIADTGGVPPRTEAELTSLPGVGPYAAAASLSLHQNVRAVIVDNNVARWLSRMTGRSYDAETRRKRWLRELADSLTPVRRFRDYNYAVLDFTMTICRPRAPKCQACPLSDRCVYAAVVKRRAEGSVTA